MGCGYTCRLWITLSLSRSTMSWISEQAKVSLKLNSLAKLILLLSSCSCSRNSCSVTGLSRMVLQTCATVKSIHLPPCNRVRSCFLWQLPDHGSRHHQFVHQLTEVAAYSLPILQSDIHTDRLLLQSLDLTTDGGQVTLEATQHALHSL